MKFQTLFLIIVGLSVSLSSQAQLKKPLALIYKGPGSCETYQQYLGCSEAAARVAQKAGFDVLYVGPGKPTIDFKKASIWIQPGGRVKSQAEAMSPELLQKIKEFVFQGGGYVGFCAGGFLATEKFGWKNIDPTTKKKIPYESAGLGILPGKSLLYTGFDKQLSGDLISQVAPTIWNNQTRHIYWELGPYFNSSSTKKAEILSYYLNKEGQNDTKHALTIRSQFGQGKVFVTGVHPEAPLNWSTYFKLQDPDGEDFDLAIDMIKWAKSSR